MALIPLDKPIVRDNFFVEYKAHMVELFSKLHPEVPKEEIDEYVKNLVDNKCEELMARYKQALANHEDISAQRPRDEMLWPTLHVVYSAHPDDPSHSHSYGNYTEMPHESLLAISRRYANKVIAPSGTFYETTNVQKSFVGTMVNNKKKARSAEKKLMLAAKNCNDKVGETFHNKKQSTIKIKMNSLPGAFGSGHNLYSSVPNYNAITSIARFCIQSAYAHAERLLEANFYFRNTEQALNFLITCNRKGPHQTFISAIMEQYKLYQPTREDVYEFIAKCIKRYTFDTDFPIVKAYIYSCSATQLAFIFYMSNMKHIVFHNEEFFRKWISELMCSEDQILAGVDLDQVDPTEIYKLDSDLVIMLSTFYNHLMPLNPKSGNTVTPYDCLTPDYNRPDIAKQLVVLGKHMAAKLDEIQPLFDLFTQHNVGIGYVAEHKNMFRDCTILSDTDSIIFTTQTWAKWWQHDKIQMNSDAYNINALVVYWLSKANANILYYLSKVLGAVGQEMMILNMKNEFMMPIEILSNRKKHYSSVLKIQEGVFYNKVKLDIKGVGFKGSSLCRSTLNYVEWFIKQVIDDINQNMQIDTRTYIIEILKFERMIYDSLMNGRTDFLVVTPINEINDYATPMASIYFNYLLWEEVFGDDYGHIVIPTKCYTLPCEDKVIRGEEYQAYLEEHNPNLGARLKQFLAKYPDKAITRVPINPQTNVIPEELRRIIDFRPIVYSNCSPLYLLLQSFGINTGTASKQRAIFSDMYGWVAEGSKPDACNIS